MGMSKQETNWMYLLNMALFRDFGMPIYRSEGNRHGDLNYLLVSYNTWIMRVLSCYCSGVFLDVGDGGGTHPPSFGDNSVIVNQIKRWGLSRRQFPFM